MGLVCTAISSRGLVITERGYLVSMYMAACPIAPRRQPCSCASPTATRTSPHPRLPTDAIQVLRRVLRGERLVNPEDAFTCVLACPTATSWTAHADRPKRQPRPHLGPDRARVIDAQSKLATARALAPESAVSTLGEVLGLGAVEHELYAAMDWVQQQAAIEQRLAKRHLGKTPVTWREPTARWRAGIAVFGLAAEGCPLASRSRARPESCQVEKIRTRSVWRVVLVGAGHADRGAHPHGGRGRPALDHAARADDPQTVAAGTATPSGSTSGTSPRSPARSFPANG